MADDSITVEIDFIRDRRSGALHEALDEYSQKWGVEAYVVKRHGPVGALPVVRLVGPPDRVNAAVKAHHRVI